MKNYLTQEDVASIHKEMKELERAKKAAYYLKNKAWDLNENVSRYVIKNLWEISYHQSEEKIRNILDGGWK